MVTPGGERVKTLNKKDEGCEKKNKQTNKQNKKNIVSIQPCQHLCTEWTSCG